MIPFISVLVFFHFQASTVLLGDSRLIYSDFRHAFEDAPTIGVPASPYLVLNHPVAKGAYTLHYLAAALSFRWFDGSSADGIRSLSCILGGLLVFIMLGILLRGSLRPRLIIWLAVIVPTSGMMVLFFGYIENYPPLVFFAMLYLITGLVTVHCGSLRWLAATTLCLLISMFMHILGVLLLPSFGLVVVRSLARRFAEARLRSITAMLVFLTLLGAFVGGTFTGYGEKLLPLVATDTAYGIFTPSHWLDMLNEMLILLPLLPVIGVMAAELLWRSAKSKQMTATAVGQDGPESELVGHTQTNQRFGSDVQFHFTLLILLPYLLFLVVFRPGIGMARDWDLFAIATVGLLPLALLTIDRFLVSGGERLISLVFLPGLVISVILAVAWVGINADAERSVSRYESFFEYDKSNQPYVYEILARHYYARGSLKKAIAALEEALATSDNPRLFSLLGYYYEQNGQAGDAIVALKKALNQQPSDGDVRRRLVSALNNAQRYDELLEVAKQGTLYHPQDPIYYYHYGAMLIKQGNIEQGERELHKAIELKPPRRTVKQIQQILNQLRWSRR